MLKLFTHTIFWCLMISSNHSCKNNDFVKTKTNKNAFENKLTKTECNH